ncbi:MAG TPA: hypothetical protein V6C72_11415 [Chroococcales cyanobacterium]
MTKFKAAVLLSMSLSLLACARFADAQPGVASPSQSIAMAPTGNARAIPNTVAAYPKDKQKADPAYPKTHYARGLYWKRKHEKNRALIEFLKASQENPKLVRAFYEQALIFRERGYLKLAQSSLEQALAVKPDYREGRVLLATIQIEQGNVGGAVKQLGQSLGLTMPGSDSDGSKEEPADELEGPLAPVLQSLHGILPVPVVSSNRHSRSENIGNVFRSSRAKRRRSAKADASAEESSAKESSLTESAIQESTVQESTVRESADRQESTGAPTGEEREQERKPQKERESKRDRSKREKQKRQKQKKEKRPKKSKGWFAKFFEIPENDENATLETAAAGAEEAHKQPDSIAENDREQQVTAEQPARTVAGAAETGLPADEPTSSAESFVPEPAAETAIKQSVSHSNQQAAPARLSASQRQFQSPRLFNAGLFSNMAKNDWAQTRERAAPKPKEDPWTVRLRYLAEHGTATLKDGEAFIYAEDTGEAALFLADGRVVRRTLTAPRDLEDLVKERRPDILEREEPVYNLSLLAKLMPTQTETQAQPPEGKTPGEPFTAGNLIGDLNGNGFWGWLRKTLNF